MLLLQLMASVAQLLQWEGPTELQLALLTVAIKAGSR